MAELSDSAEERLLSIKDSATDPGRTTAARVLVKWVLEMAMGMIFAAWLAFIFLFPAGPVSSFFEKWVVKTSSETVYGIAGPVFLVFGGPLLVITLLAGARFIISSSPEEELARKSKSGKNPGVSLWTFSVLVDGPFGVVSASELIGICLVIAYVLWAMTAYTWENLIELSQLTLPNLMEKSEQMLELTGVRLGSTGLCCLAFLFLPVARGSVLLRLIDIPFDQAVRYHAWLGHLTMLLFTLHGLCYVVAWAMQGVLLQEITSWSGGGIAILSGAISLLAGLLMWVTSLPLVRKKQFELFFYTHQLYLVFVVFFAMHVGDFVFSMAAWGIFLFMLDRFLRFCQSRITLQVVSATCLPCGNIELVLSKHGNLRYNALSFIFLQIRELAWLQWHPFSVSSSPLDGENHLSVIIKVLGGWTKKLNGMIVGISGSRCPNGVTIQPSNLTASVEGPYGHELPYHLTYKNLVLVAGGIGVSPFLAILRDILHRAREGKPCLPCYVLLIWAIKSSDELPLLSFLDTESLAPSSQSKLDLEIDIYVTRESEPPLEEGNIENGHKAENLHVSPVSNGCGMSGLVGTGNNIWSGLYVMSAIVGFIVFMTLVDIFYINRFDITTVWYRGLLFLVCMLASVLVFGGFVVLLWHWWEQIMAAAEKSEHSTQNLQSTPLIHDNALQRKSVGSKRVLYGSRPNFKEIFGSVIGAVGPCRYRGNCLRSCNSRDQCCQGMQVSEFKERIGQSYLPL